MIYAQRVFQTVGSGGLGDVVSEQSSSAAVKRVQLILQNISAFTGDGDFDPKSTHGRVNMNTAFAVISVVRKGLAEIPVLASIVAGLNQIPGLSTVLGSRGGFDVAWTAAKYSYPAELKTYLIDPIRSAAAAIDIVLKPIAAALAPGGTTTTTQYQITPYQVEYVAFTPSPGGYAAGSFAIRDPGTSKYRILTPIV